MIQPFVSESSTIEAKAHTMMATTVANIEALEARDCAVRSNTGTAIRTPTAAAPAKMMAH